ncbi:MAG: NAD(+)/NADH kinase [Eubacterium sp.]|jgi:NAD+ kinase|nr:NAD(+)/NADH kinase [Eubacterium sp.]
MKVLLCVNHEKEKSDEILDSVLSHLKRQCIVVTTESSEISICDLVMTVGGDGTILNWGKSAARARKPLLGINTGTLGFMATLEPSELDKLSRLKSGDYRVSKRMMLDVIVEEKSFLALNDAVISRETGAKLPEFRISGGGLEFSRIRADGLIFSTPTGSTAYALSAGGPILEPEISCIEFTPLCAHTLFGRTIIFSGEDALNVTFSKYSDKDEVLLSVDGGERIRITGSQAIEIKKSGLWLDIIDMSKNSFYDSVHNKLMRPLK